MFWRASQPGVIPGMHQLEELVIASKLFGIWDLRSDSSIYPNNSCGGKDSNEHICTTECSQFGDEGIECVRKLKKFLIHVWHLFYVAIESRCFFWGRSCNSGWNFFNERVKVESLFIIVGGHSFNEGTLTKFCCLLKHVSPCTFVHSYKCSRWNVLSPSFIESPNPYKFLYTIYRPKQHGFLRGNSWEDYFRRKIEREYIMGCNVMCSHLSSNFNKLVQWSQGNWRDM